MQFWGKSLVKCIWILGEIRNFRTSENGGEMRQFCVKCWRNTPLGCESMVLKAMLTWIPDKNATLTWVVAKKRNFEVNCWFNMQFCSQFLVKYAILTCRWWNIQFWYEFLRKYAIFKTSDNGGEMCKFHVKCWWNVQLSENLIILVKSATFKFNFFWISKKKTILKYIRRKLTP